MRGRKFAITAGLALAGVVGASGCGDDDASDSAPSARVVGTDYAFDMPSEIEGGVVTMDFVTEGDEPHEFALSRLQAGRTLADVDDFLATGREPPVWMHDVGGVPAMTPGEEVSITRELEEGTYVFLCYVPTADGQPHHELGMKREFTIAGDTGASLPEPDGVVSAGDDRIEVPEIEPGAQTLELRNDASGPREFELLTFDEGKGPDDAQRWFRGGFAGDPPLRLLGAMQSIPPDSSVFLTETFDSGATYFFVDEEHRLRTRFAVR